MDEKTGKIGSSAVEFTKPGGSKISLQQLVKAGEEYQRRRPYASGTPVESVMSPFIDFEEQEPRKSQQQGTGKAQKKDAPLRTPEHERIAARLQEVKKARRARRRYVVNLPLDMLENLDVVMLAKGYPSRNEVVEQLLAKALSEFDLPALRKIALGE